MDPKTATRRDNLRRMNELKGQISEKQDRLDYLERTDTGTEEQLVLIDEIAELQRAYRIHRAAVYPPVRLS